MSYLLPSIAAILLVTVQPTNSQSQGLKWGIYNCRELETKCVLYFLGSKGDMGQSGQPGIPGQEGLPGAPGPKGPKGYSGIGQPNPIFGPKGYTGIPGLKGIKGARGSQGLKGEIGDSGSGNIGFKGDKGETGFPGFTGPKGFPGSGGMVLGWKSCSWKFDSLQQYGLTKECIFNKTRPDSFLHVIYEGSMRVGFCTTCCKRWFFTFDHQDCKQGRIETKLSGTKLYSGPSYRHGRLDGYCAVAPGRISVELWVEDCPGHQRAMKASIANVETTSRIIIEEIDISA